MFAPIYRQLTHLGAFGPIDNRIELADIAYSDVLGGWRQYLAEDNEGRGVVLIGHSQGSGMLKRLIREEIDPLPARRAQLVSAILAGSNLTVERGRRAGGDFASIPVCVARRDGLRGRMVHVRRDAVPEVAVRKGAQPGHLRQAGEPQRRSGMRQSGSAGGRWPTSTWYSATSSVSSTGRSQRTSRCVDRGRSRRQPR